MAGDDKKDRDRRKVIVPPKAVLEQTASRPDAWEGLGSDEYTPPVGLTEEIHKMGRRAKDTEKAASTTLDKIHEVRYELKADFGRLEQKVDKQGEHIGTLRATTGEINGTLKVLVGQIETDRTERAESQKIKRVGELTRLELDKARILAEVDVDKSRELADVDVDKTAKITAIAEQKFDKQHRRSIQRRVVKAGLTVGLGIWTVISTYLLAHGC